MTLLAIATSSPQGSLALADGQPGALRLLHETVWEKKAMHSELATVNLQALLSASGKRIGDLTHIAVINGPGSFTGIRVGVNLARTLAYSLSLPAACFNALAVSAHKTLSTGQTGLFAIKAVQTFHYAAVYEKSASGMREILAPCSLTEEEVGARGEALKCFDVTACASDLLGMISPSTGFQSWKDVLPLYVRASEPEEKLRRGLLKPV
jgi:tRNA threonylcarbamoyl adenosine modification protein YeaZ